MSLGGLLYLKGGEPVLRSSLMKKSRHLIVVTSVILAVCLGLVAIRQYRRREKPLERGQCTWFAFERAREAGWTIEFDKPYGRHARAWWEKVTNGERGSEPRPGAIMVLDAWPGNPYGHVGYVERVESASVWHVTHANYAIGQPDGAREGVPILRVKCELSPAGVELDGSGRSLPLRGFVYPAAK